LAQKFLNLKRSAKIQNCKVEKFEEQGSNAHLEHLQRKHILRVKSWIEGSVIKEELANKV
jgi:hypothetical protein